MTPPLKISLIVTACIAGILMITYFVHAPTAVTFSFTLEDAKDDEGLLSTIILKGNGKNLLFPDVPVGTGTGCSVTEKTKFDFADSLAEVYCYYAGGGQLFQAKETDAGDLEVFRYTVSEVPKNENKTYSIDITNPQSIYTFDLSKTQRIAK